MLTADYSTDKNTWFIMKMDATPPLFNRVFYKMVLKKGRLPEVLQLDTLNI